MYLTKNTITFHLDLCYFNYGDKLMIIKDFFVNLAILISLIFLYLN